MNVSPDALAFTTIFSSFAVTGARGSHDGRAGCTINLGVDIPSGWALAVIAIDTRGYAALVSQNVALELRQKVAYGNANLAGQGKLKLRGPYDNDYQMHTEFNGQTQWSGCGARRQALRIDTELKTKHDSFATVDSIDGELQAIRLAWKRCNP